MLLVDRKSGGISSSTFCEIAQYLKPGDLLLINDTAVIPARLRGKIEGKESEAELLLLKRYSPGHWSCLGKPLRKLLPGVKVDFGQALKAEVIEREDSKRISVKFHPEHDAESLIMAQGMMPIPPYIRGGTSDLQDKTDYQSIFAKVEGSVAAPTASLHFTAELMEKISARGVKIANITLHLGTASFLPVYSDVTSDGISTITPPACEKYTVPPELSSLLRQCRDGGGRVIAIGTSVVRALESVVRDSSDHTGAMNDTDLFIEPGHYFLAVDALVTNFHQPGTTHLLLVEALLGRELLQRSYEYALANDYRFLSYGDGMFIL